METTVAQEKLRITEMIEMLHESEQQRFEYHQGQNQILNQVHPTLFKIMKNDKLTYLIYISLHYIDQRIRYINLLRHTQYIVAHQATRMHRKRNFQLNRNQQANLIKVIYKAKVLIR